MRPAFGRNIPNKLLTFRKAHLVNTFIWNIPCKWDVFWEADNCHRLLLLNIEGVNHWSTASYCVSFRPGDTAIKIHVLAARIKQEETANTTKCSPDWFITTRSVFKQKNYHKVTGHFVLLLNCFTRKKIWQYISIIGENRNVRQDLIHLS
jgi:hypothetical protein